MLLVFCHGVVLRYSGFPLNCLVDWFTDPNFKQLVMAASEVSMLIHPAAQINPWQLKSEQQCLSYHNGTLQRGSLTTDGYCPATHDTVMCWPPTKSGHTIKLPCPPLKGIDPTQFAYKSCGPEGRWLGRGHDDFSRPQGYTNYSDCFLPVIKDLLDKLGADDERKKKFSIAEGTRVVELVGWSSSLLSLVISLLIFVVFKRLQNHRTRIHRNLFVAMLIQVTFRLTVYLDQVIVRQTPSIGSGGNYTNTQHYRQGIDNTPILCETFYSLIECGRTAMYMWMFIEGHYLNSLVTVAFYQGPDSYIGYYLVGWGLPAVLTLVWALVTSHYHRTQCWWGYSLTPFYWLLEGPRFAVLIANLMFLLNIMQILVRKLCTHQHNSRERDKIRRSARAALVLLPLLGITNLFNMIPSPVHRAPWEFALWSYTTTFMRSFQGLFVTCIYCFFNYEVRNVLAHRWQVQVSMRRNSRRLSARSGSVCVDVVELPQLPSSHPPLTTPVMPGRRFSTALATLAAATVGYRAAGSGAGNFGRRSTVECPGNFGRRGTLECSVNGHRITRS